MNYKMRRIVVVLVVAALVLTALMPLLSMFARASVTKDDIANIRGELNQVTNRKKELEKHLAGLRNDLTQAKQTVETVQEKVLLTEQQISYSQALLDQYDLQIEEKAKEILELEAQEAKQLQEFYTQVRWMEETGNVSYLSILFQASTFSKMLEYAMLIGDIIDHSNRIIDQLKYTQAEIAQAQDAIRADRDAQAEVQAQLEAQKSQLDREKAEAIALMNSIAASESEYAQEAQKLAAEEREVQQALQLAEQKYAAQLNTLNNTGDWYWPLPGRYKLSSLFGGRFSPIYGRWESHTGVDIPAPGGTEIRAAQGGVVTLVGTNRNASYGYYCIINHGNGYSTLYAHQRSIPNLSVGQTVAKGQVIGYVGTTGDSTGNHLHFELRVNGSRASALKLYPGMTFTYTSDGVTQTIAGG